MNHRKQALKRLDTWLDLCIPAATALLLSGLPELAYGALGLWLVVRLILQSREHSLYLIFLGLALSNMGAMVLERGNKPSDASDLLIIALSFAAGAQRPSNRMITSLAQISFCLLPIAVAACLTEPGQLLQFPDINVNRLSFLLGLLVTASWGIADFSPPGRKRWAWMGWTSMALPLILMSGSRAPLILPILGIAISKAISHKQPQCPEARGSIQPLWKRTAATAAALVILSAGATQAWYHYSADAGINRVSDTWRTSTALCWLKQPFREGEALLGLGYANKIRKHCDSAKLPAMQKAIDDSSLTVEQRTVAQRAAAKGLPHAHNSYAQIIAETGLIGLGAVLLTTIWLARAVQRSRQKPAAEQTIQDRLILRAALPIGLYLAITGATTSFHIYLPLNQVVIGYLLAIFSAVPAEQETSA